MDLVAHDLGLPGARRHARRIVQKNDRRDIEMRTFHRSRTAPVFIAAFLAAALVTPLTVNADEPLLAAAPAAASWDESSGYGSVEASRAEVSAMWSGDLISDQHQALAFAAAATLWDAMSGYGAVEATRAANALPAAPSAFTSQVPSDVRRAPERALEHAMNPLVAAAMAWDATSGYGAVEASRADR